MKTLRTRLAWVMFGTFAWQWLQGASKLEWLMTFCVELGLLTAFVMTFLVPRRWQ